MNKVFSRIDGLGGVPAAQAGRIADALDQSVGGILDGLERQFTNEVREVMMFAYAALIEEAADRMSKIEGAAQLKHLLMARISVL